MAVAQNANEQRRDWRKRESFGSALIQVAVAALLLGGGVFFWVQRGVAKKEVADTLISARDTAVRDNPKDLEAALAQVDTVLQKNADAPEALALAADIHTELWLTHRVAGAEAKAKDFLARAEAAGANWEERYGTRPLHLLAAGQSREAEQHTEDLRKRGANSAKILFALARAYNAEGQLALSRTAFKQATDKAWKNPRYYTAFAEALLDDGSVDLALEQLQKAQQANPEHVRARLTLALARLYKKDRVKDAEDIANELEAQKASLTPGMQARLLAVRAELAVLQQRPDEAVKLADEAVALNPDEHYALLAKAHALAQKNDAGAVDAYKAAAAKRRTATLPYFEGAAVLRQANNLDGATALLAAYEDAFKGVTLESSDGKSVPALDKDDRFWIARGDVLRAGGKNAEALTAYEKAIAANSVNLGKAHYAKGALLLSEKKYDEALAELTLVTPEDGTGGNADAYLARGEVLFAKKDYPAGCQNFAFALARLKREQAPRERLNGILEDVRKKLVSAGQSGVAKAWMDEAKPIIQ